MEQHTFIFPLFSFSLAESSSNFHRSVWRMWVRWTLFVVSLSPLILLCSLFSKLLDIVMAVTTLFLPFSRSTITSESLAAPQVVLVFWKLLFAIEVNFSEPLDFPNRGKILFSTLSWALRSFEHRQAFIKDFLKLSLLLWEKEKGKRKRKGGKGGEWFIERQKRQMMHFFRQICLRLYENKLSLGKLHNGFKLIFF